ncbi:uncharacterized protein HKW66_Vig0103160 [Vigna angularis]|uniref:Uncharacterized protein n=2 Tax=Phaseolus angularis TaxID=3914 RepID=A0A8T0KK29_PHAAN|nr:uncharacterized protein HKW66_Vig0103160 [Vigna angularis]BAT78662.1 hypothetical protein VIGAN_02137100 [Vigna angularis var. angularis]
MCIMMVIILNLIQYCEMHFDADVCELEIDFNVLDHMHDVPVEVVDFTPCFDNSNIINSAFSIDRVHIPASSVFDDSTYLNALFDEELDAHDDRHAVFDDVKVDLADFENACTDLGLELELEFAGFLNSLELNNEKLTACTCLGGGCEICEEIISAICSACIWLYMILFSLPFCRFWWVLLSLGATLVGGNDHKIKGSKEC